MDKLKKYQRYCWQHYEKKIGLLENYSYLYGNPIEVHVPIETARNGFMIVGAYPTAHFQTIGPVRDVPVADHLYPFSCEKYFDGTRVRTVNSGAELQRT